jgi:amidase
LVDAILIEALALGGNGPTVVVKDSIDVAGHASRAASRVLENTAPAKEHADVVAALIDAGCRIVGKANMHELAYGVTGLNEWTGTPANPLYPGRVPGGSSSGSAAAVAASLCDIALGTDTGGSIRIPAACCGVFGLKPSYGRISRRGVMPEYSSLDCVGPFAGSLGTIERAMAMLDPDFRSEAAVRSPTFGVVTVAADDAVLATVQSRLAASGAVLRPATLPSMKIAFDAGLTIIGAENWAAFGHLAQSDAMGADVRLRLLAAATITAEDVAKAEQVRAAFIAEVDDALADVDALVLPTMPDFPLALAQAADAHAAIGVTAFVRPFNLSGHPALSIPLQAHNGLPVGLQLVGRRGEDARLCAIARALITSEQQEQDHDSYAG